MRIDASAAFATPNRFQYPWTRPHMRRDFSPEDLHRILARNRFEGAILRAITNQPAEETAWLLEFKASYPWILGVIGTAQTGVCSVTATLDTFETAASTGLPVDLSVNPAELASLSPRIAPHPTVLVNTAGATFQPGEFETWSRDLAPLAACPNICVKISGLINNAGPEGWNAVQYRPYVQFLLTHFGPDRLIYGSDWPHCMATGTWKEHLAAFTQALGAQTLETRDKILGGNATRFYNLSGPNAKGPAA